MTARQIDTRDRDAPLPVERDAPAQRNKRQLVRVTIFICHVMVVTVISRCYAGARATTVCVHKLPNLTVTFL